MSNLVFRNCPYCDSDNSVFPSTNYGDRNWPIKRCNTCGFVYIEIVPAYDRLIEEFAWEKTSAAEANRRVSQEPIKQSISKRLKIIRRRWLRRDKLHEFIRRYVRPGHVLDVGCGGTLCKLDPIYVPHGIEISEALALRAQAQLKPLGGYVTHQNALSGLRDYPTDYFSGVLLSAFLEHEIYPKELLREVCRTLIPSGRCIIKVPNFGSLNRVIRSKKWCGFRLPDHINYFTPSSLAGMCRDIGFHIVRFTITDRLPTSDNMWIVIQKSNPAVNANTAR